MYHTAEYRSPHSSHLVALILIKEVPPNLITTQPHPLDLRRLESVHCDTPHETDMYTQSSVNTRTRQTYEHAEFRGSPLWRWSPAVCASIIAVGLLDFEQL